MTQRHILQLSCRVPYLDQDRFTSVVSGPNRATFEWNLDRIRINNVQRNLSSWSSFQVGNVLLYIVFYLQRSTLHKKKNIEISKLQRELKIQKTNSVQKSAATKQTPRTSTGRNHVTSKSAASSTLPQQGPRERVYYAALAPPNFNNRLGLPL